jgi:non-ribosomal peptide synthetase component F
VGGASSSLASFHPDLYSCKLVTESVEASCHSSSQAVALVDVTTPDQPLHLTYQQLWSASFNIAQAVQASTLSQGHQAAAACDGVAETSCCRQPVVGVLVGRSWRLVAALLGVLRAGAAYVPLDPEYPPQRLATYCRGAAVDLVLIDGSSEDAGRMWDNVLQDLDGSSPPQVSYMRHGRHVRPVQGSNRYACCCC